MLVGRLKPEVWSILNRGAVQAQGGGGKGGKGPPSRGGGKGSKGPPSRGGEAAAAGGNGGKGGKGPPSRGGGEAAAGGKGSKGGKGPPVRGSKGPATMGGQPNSSLPLVAYHNSVWPKGHSMHEIPGGWDNQGSFRIARVALKVEGSLWELKGVADEAFQPDLIRKLQHPSMLPWIERFSVKQDEDSAISEDSLLSKLSISAGLLRPSFNMNRFGYKAEVVDSVKTFVVRANTRHARAKIKFVNGEKCNSSKAAHQVPLVLDENNNMVITVGVEAQDGQSMSEYTVTLLAKAAETVSVLAGARSGGIDQMLAKWMMKYRDIWRVTEVDDLIKMVRAKVLSMDPDFTGQAYNCEDLRDLLVLNVIPKVDKVKGVDEEQQLTNEYGADWDYTTLDSTWPATSDRLVMCIRQIPDLEKRIDTITKLNGLTALIDNIGKVTTAAADIAKACEMLCSCKSLRKLLHAALGVGNFLNFHLLDNRKCNTVALGFGLISSSHRNSLKVFTQKEIKHMKWGNSAFTVNEPREYPDGVTGGMEGILDVLLQTDSTGYNSTEMQQLDEFLRQVKAAVLVGELCCCCYFSFHLVCR